MKRSAYPIYIETEEGTIIARFYIVDLDMSLFHFERRSDVEQVILIPTYKRTSKNNYIYHIVREVIGLKKRF